MFGLGLSELIIILILLVFFCGGKRLPHIGEGLGRSISEFKRSLRGTRSDASIVAEPSSPLQQSSDPAVEPLASPELLLHGETDSASGVKKSS